jgi:large subunit ribosomal protein L4
MDISIHNSSGEIISKVRLSDSVFKIKPNDDVIFRAVMSENTNSRQGTSSTKTRSEVSGGGKKPWKQKGRGAARAGTIRSPLWKGGGITHGPKPKNYKYDLPKKMKQLARRSVLSQRIKDKQIIVVDELKFDTPKTKNFLNLMISLGINDKKVAFFPEKNIDVVFKSARNLPNVTIVVSKNASTYDLLDAEVLLFDKEGIKALNKQLEV